MQSSVVVNNSENLVLINQEGNYLVTVKYFKDYKHFHDNERVLTTTLINPLNRNGMNSISTSFTKADLFPHEDLIEITNFGYSGDISENGKIFVISDPSALLGVVYVFRNTDIRYSSGYNEGISVEPAYLDFIIYNPDPCKYVGFGTDVELSNNGDTLFVYCQKKGVILVYKPSNDEGWVLDNIYD